MVPFDTSDVPFLTSRLRGFIASGRALAARTLLSALLRLIPRSAEAVDLEAQVLLLEGRAHEALALLDQAVTSGIDSSALRLRRADLHLRGDDFSAAATDAADALVLQPRSVAAKALLGIALMRLDRRQDGIICLREAVGNEPENAEYRQALALAEEAAGDADAASAVLERGTVLNPGHVGLRTAAIILRLRLAEFAAAEALADMARRDGVADACILGLLGHARSSLGNHEAAAEAYSGARKLAPEDPYVRHLAAAAGLSPDAGRAAPEYVRVVFDGYAARFDSHLISLGYRIPGLLRAELASMVQEDAPKGLVLDLGCGTGLVAVAVSDLNLGPMIGVDPSPAMLREASRHEIYAELHVADIEAFLNAETRLFPMIVAADVMPYFGDLDAIIRLVATRLAPAGRFLFSVEAMAVTERLPWRLGRLGRYAHAEHHVAAAAQAAGLEVMFMRREAIRLEGQAAVPGYFVSLRRGDCV